MIVSINANDVHIIEAIDDMFEPIDRIKLMDKMSKKQTFDLSDTRYLESAVNNLKSIQTKHFKLCVKAVVDYINNNIINKLTTEEKKQIPGLVLKAFNTSIMLCQTTIYTVESCGKKDLEALVDKVPEFIDKTYKMAIKIKENRIKVMKIIDEIVDELKEQSFVDISNLLQVKALQKEYFGGKETIVIQYDKFTCPIDFNYSRDFTTHNDEKEIIRKKVFETLHSSITKGFSKEIKDVVELICKENDLKNTYFLDLPVESEKEFDFSKGYINRNFRITNKNRGKFVEQFLGAINTIRYIKFHGLFIGNQNVLVGTKYYCKFIKDEKVDNDIYTFYDIRDGGKPLIYIFKNGIRLSETQRIKMLTKFGYGRKK